MPLRDVLRQNENVIPIQRHHQPRSQIMKTGRVVFAALAGALFAGSFGPASAQQTIRIG